MPLTCTFRLPGFSDELEPDETCDEEDEDTDDVSELLTDDAEDTLLTEDTDDSDETLTVLLEETVFVAELLMPELTTDDVTDETTAELGLSPLLLSSPPFSGLVEHDNVKTRMVDRTTACKKFFLILLSLLLY